MIEIILTTSVNADDLPDAIAAIKAGVAAVSAAVDVGSDQCFIAVRFEAPEDRETGLAPSDYEIRTPEGQNPHA